MEEQKIGKAGFWEAAGDATRIILFPFGTVLGWLVGAVFLAIPETVDRFAGYGQILSSGTYRIIGAIVIVVAAWHTWLLARRQYKPSALTVTSALLALAACALAYFAATSGAPFRPAVSAILWLLVLYMVLAAAWYALVAWNSTGPSIGDGSAQDSGQQPIPGPAQPALRPGESGQATAGRAFVDPYQVSLCMAMLTAPSEKAEVIARRLVDERLAACSQVPGEMTSFFWWNKEVNRERERIIYLKTRTDLLPEIEAVLKEVHPYELPELILLPIVGGLTGYLRWMEAELKPATGARADEPSQEAGSAEAETPETAQETPPESGALQPRSIAEANDEAPLRQDNDNPAVE